jgi:hypothetical protein
MHRITTFALYLLVPLSILALSTPVQAVSPMIQGWAWIDQNCDGLHQDAEAPLTTVAVYLYRFGPDGVAFSADDKQLRGLPLYISGPNAGQYKDTTDSAIMPAERYRLSILQGGRPDGYLPTRYRQGSDPARWSSLQANWTTGDPNNGGFLLDPNGTVTGGNIGIAPVACIEQWYPNHLYLPLVLP